MKLAALVLTFLSASPAFAIHVYAGYSCENDRLTLNYDGPGSNYAVGGYSNFRLRGDTSEEAGQLAYQIPGPDESAQIGEEVGDSKLQVIFEMTEAQVIKGSNTIDKKVGERCVPEEYDFVHTESKSIDSVKISEISPEAAAKLGLTKGDVLTMNCVNTMDTPVKCPKKGRYTRESLGE